MKIDFYYSLNKIKSYLKQVTDVLLVVVAVALLLGVLFGPDAPFVGAVYSNLVTILDTIGAVSYTHLTLPTNREV